MKALNNLALSVFCKEEEDEKAIYDGFLKLLPFDLEKEKIEVKRTVAISFRERKIIIYEVRLEKERHTKQFLENLLQHFSGEQKELLLRQLDSRLDEDFNFFMRLDKKRLIDGEYFITDSGDCYHIRMNVAAFPRKKENVVEVLKEILA